MTAPAEKAIYSLIRKLGGFHYSLSGLDRVWNVLCPAPSGKWQHIQVLQYRDTFYLGLLDARPVQIPGIEVVVGKQVRLSEEFVPGSARGRDRDPLESWAAAARYAGRWLEVAKRDWIKAARRVAEEYPLDCRWGTVPHAVVRASLPDVYRLDHEVGKRRCGKFVRLVEEGHFSGPGTSRESLTANQYFDYCKVAYLAARRKDEPPLDESLSGRELYAMLADGRHDGLVDIEGDSAGAFADWLDGKHPRRTHGGHPFEIKRGGNTTHIDLRAFRPRHDSRAFLVELDGAAIGRLAETVKMFLALHGEGLPVSVAGAEAVRKRLLAEDNIGLVPHYAPRHRANQHFHPDLDVWDVMHYFELGRYKRRVAPFLAWETLPVLRPR